MPRTFVLWILAEFLLWIIAKYQLFELKKSNSWNNINYSATIFGQFCFAFCEKIYLYKEIYKSFSKKNISPLAHADDVKGQ